MWRCTNVHPSPQCVQQASTRHDNEKTKRLQRLCLQGWCCRVHLLLENWICSFFSPPFRINSLFRFRYDNQITHLPLSLRERLQCKLSSVDENQVFSTYNIRWAVVTGSRIQHLAPFLEEKNKKHPTATSLYPNSTLECRKLTLYVP